MSDVALRVSSLGKSYWITHERRRERFRYKTLREDIVDVSKGLLKRLGSPSTPSNGPSAEELWAVKDVSFEVNEGEVVGIIGRNGAGKSTLLKILSRITDPTSGRVDIYGRVGALLEVGTGFHPELTGRENIYLNGAILGMSKAEIRGKFDQIVAFAEVEKFVDTPVKRFSSGMYVRLAFAVAAHLEPEILIIDEVLAVGDASFQRKCLSKMEEVGQQGRTVLFVSHNMAAITRLCGRTILMDQGQIVADGPSHEVASAYLSSGVGTTAAREWPDPAKAPGNDIVTLRAARVRLADGRTSDSVDIRELFGIEVEFDVITPGHVLVPNFHLSNEEGTVLFITIDQDPVWRRIPRERGRYLGTAWVPGNFLAEGAVIVAVAITTFEPETVHVHERDAVAFHIVDSTDGNSARGDYGGPLPGAVRPLLKWTTEFASAEKLAKDCPPVTVG